MLKNEKAGHRNICGDRVRMGRELQTPPMTRKELANELCKLGVKIDEKSIERIENKQRRLSAYELLLIGDILNVSLDWLCERSSKTSLLK